MSVRTKWTPVKIGRLSCVEAAKERKFAYHTGIARSHDSFYTDREEEIDAYWSKRGVLGELDPEALAALRERIRSGL